MADIPLNFRRQVRTAIAVQANNKVHHLNSVMAATMVARISSTGLHLDLDTVAAMAVRVNSIDLHLVSVTEVAILAPIMALEMHFQAVAAAANRAVKIQTVAVAHTRTQIHLVQAKIVRAVITVSINKVRVLVPAQDHHHSWAIIINQVINQVINLEDQAAYSLICIVIIHSFIRCQSKVKKIL